MGLDLVRRWLAEDNAKHINYKDNELLFQRELIRNWPGEPDSAIEDGVTYLWEYASADNLTAQQFVTDPQTTRQTYSGVWRQVSVEKATTDNEAETGGISGIVQTLRYGFAQRLNWDEARIINGTQLSPGNTSVVTGVANTTSDNPEDYLMVQWVNLDPNYTRVMSLGTDASTYLVGNTVASPEIRGVTYTGSWHKILVSVGESDLRDGSGTITVLFARPQFVLNAYQTTIRMFNGATRTDDIHYLWNVPKPLAQGILDAYKAGGAGRTGTASYAANNMVNLTLGDTDTSPLYLADDVSGGACSFVETVTFYWGVYDPSGGVYDITDHQYYQDPGWTITKDMSLVKADGLFDIKIIARHQLLRNYDYKLTERSPLQEAQMYQQFAVQASGDGDLMAMPASTDGWMYRRNIDVQPDCSKNVQLTAIKGKSHQLGLYSRRALLANDWQQKDENLVSIGVLSTASLAHVAVQTADVNEFGLYDTITTTTQSVSTSLYFAHPGRDGAVWGWMYNNYREWPTVGLAALSASRINSVSPSINLDGTYDILIRTSPPSGGSGLSPNQSFYYSHFQLDKLSWKLGDEGGRSQALGYRSEGFYHWVKIFATEAQARAHGEKGWSARTSQEGILWRCDVILGVKVQTLNAVPAENGIGSGAGAISFPATS